MMNPTQRKEHVQRFLGMLDAHGVAMTAQEREAIEVADFGLGEFERTGLGLLVYVNSDRYCAKELVMYPRQTCPEHRHPPFEGTPGKTETFRCRWGQVFLYVEGAAAGSIKGQVPAGSAPHYTVFHEIVLNPGDQYTIGPDTRHWFQAGAQGAIVSEFSSPSRDDLDVFTDPRIVRVP